MYQADIYRKNNICTSCVFNGFKYISRFEFPNKQFSENEDSFIRTELSKLLLEGQVEICESIHH